MADIMSSVTPLPERVMKDYQWLDALLQGQAATEKAFQPAWQAYKYQLRGKLYAYIGMHDKHARPILTLKLEPAFSEVLRQTYEDIVPGYYMNKMHWSTVYLDGGVPQDVLADIVQASHRWALSSLSQRAQREIRGE